MITYNQWLDYFQLDENGEPVNGDDGLPITLGKEYYFDITVSQFNLDVASSTGFDPQDLAYGLEVRFAGGTDASVATADDEFEIEVYSSGMDATVSEVNTMTQTRGGYGIAVKRSLRI